MLVKKIIYKVGCLRKKLLKLGISVKMSTDCYIGLWISLNSASRKCRDIHHNLVHDKKPTQITNCVHVVRCKLLYREVLRMLRDHHTWRERTTGDWAHENRTAHARVLTASLFVSITTPWRSPFKIASIILLSNLVRTHLWPNASKHHDE